MAFRLVCFFAAVAVASAQYGCGVPAGISSCGVGGYPAGISSCGAQNAPGVYSVPLNNCGPLPGPATLVNLPGQVTPTQQQPTVTLPSPPVPCPQTVAHSCQCQKTIVKPQPYQKTITVPSVQNVVQHGYYPVTETINYVAVPNCADGGILGGYGAQGLVGGVYGGALGGSCGGIYGGAIGAPGLIGGVYGGALGGSCGGIYGGAIGAPVIAGLGGCGC